MRKKLNRTKNTPANYRGEWYSLSLPGVVYSIWLGRQDSNLRMLVPKTSALPLGDAPLTEIDFTLIEHFAQS